MHKHNTHFTEVTIDLKSNPLLLQTPFPGAFSVGRIGFSLTRRGAWESATRGQVRKGNRGKRQPYFCSSSLCQVREASALLGKQFIIFGQTPAF